MITNIIKDRAVAFLEAKLTSTNAGTEEQLKKGNLVIRDQRMYVNRPLLVGTGSTFEMVDKVVSAQVGVTSFEKGKTEDSLSMGVTGIIARYAPVVNSTNEKIQPYSEFVFDYTGAQRVPSELLNAEIEVKVGSVTIYQGRLASLFVNGREGNGNGSNYLELKAPKFIQGKQDVQFLIRFASGVTLPGTPTHNHFLQIELDGAATSQKI